jgi:hypothetical protein
MVPLSRTRPKKNPRRAGDSAHWIPAFAGMTNFCRETDILRRDPYALHWGEPPCVLHNLRHQGPKS